MKFTSRTFIALCALAAAISSLSLNAAGPISSAIDASNPVLISIEVRRIPKSLVEVTSDTLYIKDDPRAPTSSQVDSRQIRLLKQRMLPQNPQPTTSTTLLKAQEAQLEYQKKLGETQEHSRVTQSSTAPKLIDFSGRRQVGTVLARPSIAIIPGETGEIAITSDQNLDYFVPRDGGGYDIKHLSEPTGIKVKIATKPDPNGGIFLDQFAISLSVVESRNVLPGTTLNVGEPVISKRDSVSSFHLKPAEPATITASMGEDQLVIRVSMESSLPSIVNNSTRMPWGDSSSPLR